MLSNLKMLDLYATIIVSHYLSLAFEQAQVSSRNVSQLPPHIQNFKLVFAKENFDTLLKNC